MLIGTYANQEIHYQSALGLTIGALKQDATETIIHHLNDYHVQKGSATSNWVKRDFNYLDLYMVGSIMQDEIDYCRIEHKHKQLNHFVYKFDETDEEMTMIENHLPNVSKRILNLIDRITFNGVIPQQLYSYISGRRGYQQQLENQIANNLVINEPYIEYTEEEFIRMHGNIHQSNEPIRDTQSVYSNVSSRSRASRRQVWEETMARLGNPGL